METHNVQCGNGKQIPLPFPQWKVPQHTVKLLIRANAEEYLEKKEWFYPFKSAFLRKYGVPSGVDLQIIQDECWCEDGTFRGVEFTLPEWKWETCWKCNGTGIYRTRKILLARWMIRGVVFHEPTTLNPELTGTIIQETIHGLIKHEGTTRRKGRWAMIILFMLYDRRRLVRFWKHRAATWWSRQHWALRQRWRTIRRRWEVEDEDIPF
jgi:hypothetical protein